MKLFFKSSNQQFIYVLKSSLWLLAATFFFCELFQHFFIEMNRISAGAEGANLISMLGAFVTSLFEFVLLTMLVPLRVMEFDKLQNRGQTQPGSFIEFTKKHMSALAIESIRSMAVTLLWTLMFILPGIFKYIRYTFVPYVVVADPEYEKNNRDALDYSNTLIKGFTVQITLFLMLLFAIDYARSAVREVFPLAQSPILAILTGLIFYTTNLYANVLLFRIYQLRVEAVNHSGGPNGPNV